ncbi:hypothetical protein WJX74_009806 [Apatococcus lobatus]|uniref:NAD(+) diphosphatase n=1 Tax=Apatococcus lobatus TaxID=904363 RepID=A0AAW1Q5A6_9CHLO
MQVDNPLVTQAFASNKLNRSAGDKRDPAFVSVALRTPLLLFVNGAAVCVREAESKTALFWASPRDLERLGLGIYQDQISSQGSASAAISPYLLGQDSGKWKFALDVTGHDTTIDRIQAAGYAFQELRPLMDKLPASDLATGGQAVALSQWHRNHSFCPRCGAPMQPVEAGAKRACTENARHREYPRTDAVAIMLIESEDGQSALLGRSKSIRNKGILTCLSGFIEQGESIEEAVRREVLEEAGLPVSSVVILGSQPWPIGRGGSCELMIGCIAKAAATELHPDMDEMDDVRWIPKNVIKQVVHASSQPDHPYMGGKGELPSEIDFWIPPPFAIAHHLIKTWAGQTSSPWFAKL